jgi:hypothetical protein
MFIEVTGIDGHTFVLNSNFVVSFKACRRVEDGEIGETALGYFIADETRIYYLKDSYESLKGKFKVWQP